VEESRVWSIPRRTAIKNPSKTGHVPLVADVPLAAEANEETAVDKGQGLRLRLLGDGKWRHIDTPILVFVAFVRWRFRREAPRHSGIRPKKVLNGSFCDARLSSRLGGLDEFSASCFPKGGGSRLY